MIKDLWIPLIMAWIVVGIAVTVCIAFSANLMCRNNIAPIDYIVPVRVVGCWLGGHPMNSKEKAE